MTALSRPFRRILGRSPAMAPPAAAATQALPVEHVDATIDIPENDALFAYLQAAPGPVDLFRLELVSPALDRLRAAGVTLVVPLVTQGELIGTLNLGPRLSEQDYSSDDRRLLGTLAAQAAPAIRVAQLVREQAAEAAERERYEQELHVAQLIQQQFLPRHLPDLPEWQVAAYYGPARVVGGDFYDFIDLGEGRLGVVVGDVTDKGVPAALVMARTHSILRAEAPRLVDPSRVLARANELLVPEMPAHMFVTCLYGVLETATGRFRFANAGHNLPYVRGADGVAEVRATGMPLGLLPGMPYDEMQTTIGPGQDVLLTSDGIVEAHDRGGAMYGFPRLRERFGDGPSGADLLDRLLDDLHAFTGQGWEQEDDITLVTLRRTAGDDVAATGTERRLDSFSVPAQPGNERQAMDRVAAAVAPLGLAPARLERLRTAVSEATMNAIEYGNDNKADLPVDIEVAVDGGGLRVRITDHALSGPIPDAQTPDLDAKLAGVQKPRGWGLFLIEQMVDDIAVIQAGGRQTVTLTMHLGGDADGRPTPNDAP